jgi:hypothetical protein
MIRTALETRVSTPYVNATGAWTRCELWGISDVDACLDNIVTGYSKFIVGADGTTSSEWIHKGCAYPSANYVPTDCYCGWECAEGFTQCGNSCIDASVTTCQSGVAITKTRRSNIPVCDAGAELCPMPLKGFECLNTSSDLEACGGCPFQQGSVDCTSLPGVDHVECIGGECKVNSCARGWVLVDGQCQVA